ncbi:adenylate/guanylate cyclase domain-containing protein [Vibrio vulnificus]|nr:adenylate/guanylate cyclase domain-containing protein [Vibrio vulnificus]EHH0793155.1 adenylate/guanylate cyclase domain-containing protein [Vibrio vulnificus]ELE1962639.1 adenylate/guanylate cyclase domain-containing protein [Vibrio vulnificus]
MSPNGYAFWGSETNYIKRTVPMRDKIEKKVKSIIDDGFDVTDIDYIPDIDDKNLTFGNKGLRFEAVTLFIDMRGSTKVLNQHNRTTVAKLHKSYFHTIVTIAKSFGGEVRSFNGDGMLVFFKGTSRQIIGDAVEAAMKMKWMLASEESVVNKKMEKYSSINFGIGIDGGKVLCSKIGITGSNNRDLVWIGNAVNKSVKIGDSLSGKVGISSWIYENLNRRVKYVKRKNIFGVDVDKNMWEEDEFDYNKESQRYYTTTYYWEFS